MSKKLLALALGGCTLQANAQNLIDNYLTGTPTYTVIANSSNQVSQPRDLDFKPFTNELWIVNRGTANGGSNVIIYNAGETGQSTQYRQDSHSGHFMIYPSAIAFGEKGEFANTNEILNTVGPGSTFMGPALWSSDTAIFARVFQNNWVGYKPLGSHLDMLHQSPFSMGIAHDTGSAYWVFDGHNGNLCKYDFGMHHSPGYDDHSNGRVWRYSDVTLTREANLPGHMIKDKSTGWLYIIDAGAKKLKRVNTNTGTIAGTLTVPASGAEPLAGYWNVTGATVEVLDSFNSTKPCGIDLYNGRLIVGDNANGDIHVYDITGTTPSKLGVIATGQTGMMGLKIGHDGKIWFVNNTQNTVVRIDPSAGVNDDAAITAITAPTLYSFVPDFYHPSFNVCDNSIAPVVTLTNTGANTLSSVTINYQIDNGTTHTYNWNGSLAPGASTSVTLPSVNVTHGAHELSVEAVNPNNTNDANPANNKKAGAFRVLDPVATYPFHEHFSSSVFPPSGWTYLGHNFHNEMSYHNANGGCIKMNNFDGGEDIAGQRDYLITPRIDFSSASAQVTLNFSVAYAQYDASTNDALTINVSTDCGQTWTQVFHKSGSSLATVPASTTSYTPSSASDWRTESVSLAAYAGMSDVMIQFLTTSGYGNNLYIDDISIDNTTGVNNTLLSAMNIYPNPAKDMVIVEGIPAGKKTTIDVYDMMGRMVKNIQSENATGKITFDVSELASGTYVVKIASDDAVRQQKITVVK